MNRCSLNQHEDFVDEADDCAEEHTEVRYGCCVVLYLHVPGMLCSHSHQELTCSPLGLPEAPNLPFSELCFSDEEHSVLSPLSVPAVSPLSLLSLPLLSLLSLLSSFFLSSLFPLFSLSLLSLLSLSPYLSLFSRWSQMFCFSFFNQRTALNLAKNSKKNGQYLCC